MSRFDVTFLAAILVLIAVTFGLMWWALRDCNCRCTTYSVKPLIMICHDLPKETPR